MKLTKRGEYALRTLIRLGLCHHQGESAVPVSVLAAREQLPSKFTENILATLRAAGYVKTVRGKDGGTCLAVPMHSIRLGDVARLIEGDLAPLACTSDTHYERCTCPNEETCGLRMLMIDVHRAVAAILDRYTLEDVVTLVGRRICACPPSPPPADDEPSAPPAMPKSHSDPADGFLAMLASSLSPKMEAPGA